LDRVDVMGYGPTHPRVAFVVVGETKEQLIKSVKSIFMNTDLNRIFVVCAVLDDGKGEDPDLVKKLRKIEEGSVPHWHGMKRDVHIENGPTEASDMDEDNSHSPKIHVMFHSQPKGLAASRSDAAEFVQILVRTHVEDGTGALNVKQWADDNDAEAIGEMKRQNAREGIYVKVIGQISDYDGKKQLVANSVQALSSANELTHHLLEVMYSAEKFKQADSIISAPMMNNGMAFGNNNSMKQEMGSGDASGSIKERVLQFLRDNDSETGAPIEDCIRQLSDVAESDIRQAAEHLSEEGQIYSTINENFFKVAM